MGAALAKELDVHTPRHLLTILILLLLTGRAVAEVQVWTEAGVDHAFDKRVDVGCDVELRLDETGTSFDRLAPGCAVGWRPTRWLLTRLGYDFLVGDKKAGYEYAHRANLDLGLRYRPLKPLRLELRIRYQEQRGGTEAFDIADSRHTLRGRLKVEWTPARRTSLVADAELFVDAAAATATKWRATIGPERRLGDHRVGVYYGLELPLDDEETVHIIGLAYRYAP
jgi:hypothetical protein